MELSNETKAWLSSPTITHGKMEDIILELALIGHEFSTNKKLFEALRTHSWTNYKNRDGNFWLAPNQSPDTCELRKPKVSPIAIINELKKISVPNTTLSVQMLHSHMKTVFGDDINTGLINNAAIRLGKKLGWRFTRQNSATKTQASWEFPALASPDNVKSKEPSIYS